ncbi:MAG: diphosphate--fructose-6-phosphate 1-phosphotransferase [Lachnospiraceae bacterium]|nr:diphosphate--fructose-6-phosphate 1-phosphotransferase [Lachnospiraceae bacterium]
MNILVAHGGGPTPVMNSSLRGVIEGARAHGSKGRIYAARFGAEGILKGDLMDLTDLGEDQVRRLSQTPASAIGSCRRKLSEKDYPAVLECMREHDIQCLLYNGGNDSMDTCHKLSELAKASGRELYVMGIPKTIDNDLDVTDHCPGYGSAARFAAVAAAEIGADASALPIHVVVMEVMGRNAGWLTAAASLGSEISGCEMITLLPERPLDLKAFLPEVEKRYAGGKGLLVAVSEGVCDLAGNPLADSGIVDGFGHKVPGGAAQKLSEIIMQELGIKSRSEKPGLLGRACMAYVSERDREEAYQVGYLAVQAALQGKSGSMIAMEVSRSPRYHVDYIETPLALVANKEKKFPVEWIRGFDIEEGFKEYALPLMGEALPVYTRLR